MEVLDIRLLLPAMVSFKKDDKEYSVFVYVDQLKKDIIVPDVDGIDVDALKVAFGKFFNSKNKVVKVPPLPEGNFQDFHAKNFTGE